MKKETFTQDELGLIATSLNAKIRELEGALKHPECDEKLHEEITQQLSEVKYLQQKAFRIYSFK